MTTHSCALLSSISSFCRYSQCLEQNRRKSAVYFPIFYCSKECEILHDIELLGGVKQPLAAADHKTQAVFARAVSLPDVKEKRFNKKELEAVLAPHLFKRSGATSSPDNRWSLLYQARDEVAPTAGKAIHAILGIFLKGTFPIVELGAGTGYDVPVEDYPEYRDICSRIIHTQPSAEDCETFCASRQEPIYKMGIEDIFKLKKPIPAFFALNVFDTFSTPLKRDCVSKISQMQTTGDRTILMQDVHPMIEILWEDLITTYPDFLCLPYFPTNKFASCMLIPKCCCGDALQEWTSNYTPEMMFLLFGKEANQKMDGITTPLQTALNAFKQKQHVKTFTILQFFESRMRKLFESHQYVVETGHHRAFEPADCDAVTDTFLFRYKTAWGTPPFISGRNLAAFFESPQFQELQEIEQSKWASDRLLQQLSIARMQHQKPVALLGAGVWYLVATKK